MSRKSSNNIYVLLGVRGMINSFHYLGHIFLRIINPETFLESAKKLENYGVYIQAFPCKYLLDIELVEIAAKIALRDFIDGVNRAKKISTEFLLRLTGLSQIRDVFKNFFDLVSYDAILAIFYEVGKLDYSDKDELLKFVIENLRGCRIYRDLNCRGDLDLIIEKYKISENELLAVSRPNLSRFEKIKRLILERIAMSIYK